MDPAFLVTAAIGVVSALCVVTRRNPVYSAVWLLICFISFAVVFLELSAPFLAAIHVLVYTGAILVLFLFVIMLLNLKPDEVGEEYPLGVKALCGVGCAALFLVTAVPIWNDPDLAQAAPTPPPDFGSVANVGAPLFNVYALPFELVSLLIMVAMFGAMVLAKKRLWSDAGSMSTMSADERSTGEGRGEPLPGRPTPNDNQSAA